MTLIKCAKWINDSHKYCCVTEIIWQLNQNIHPESIRLQRITASKLIHCHRRHSAGLCVCIDSSLVHTSAIMCVYDVTSLISPCLMVNAAISNTTAFLFHNATTYWNLSLYRDKPKRWSPCPTLNILAALTRAMRYTSTKTCLMLQVHRNHYI